MHTHNIVDIRALFPSIFSSIETERNLKNDRQMYLSTNLINHLLVPFRFSAIAINIKVDENMPQADPDPEPLELVGL